MVDCIWKWSVLQHLDASRLVSTLFFVLNLSTKMDKLRRNDPICDGTNNNQQGNAPNYKFQKSMHGPILVFVKGVHIFHLYPGSDLSKQRSLFCAKYHRKKKSQCHLIQKFQIKLYSIYLRYLGIFQYKIWRVPRFNRKLSGILPKNFQIYPNFLFFFLAGISEEL